MQCLLFPEPNPGYWNKKRSMYGFNTRYDTKSNRVAIVKTK